MQEFYPQDICSFSVFFYLNENELIQQLCPTQYIENEISNSEISTSNKINKKKNKRKKQKHKTNFKIIISKTPEKLSLTTLITNYHKSLLLPFVITP